MASTHTYVIIIAMVTGDNSYFYYSCRYHEYYNYNHHGTVATVDTKDTTVTTTAICNTVMVNKALAIINIIYCFYGCGCSHYRGYYFYHDYGVFLGREISFGEALLMHMTIYYHCTTI